LPVSGHYARIGNINDTRNESPISQEKPSKNGQMQPASAGFIIEPWTKVHQRIWLAGIFRNLFDPVWWQDSIFSSSQLFFHMHIFCTKIVHLPRW
jgi:hypothetical protein